MKNLPIGNQYLSEFAETDSIYVDKTKLVYQLAKTSKYYFLSRPRRFGKSLLVSTLQELFEGNKILFRDLWIEDNWDWSQKSPVILMSFAPLDYQNMPLGRAIEEALSDIAKDKGITLTKKTFKTQFGELIKILYKQHGRVVILIDEYDKPIIEYLEDNHLKQAKANQKVLKAFYSVLKDAGQMLRMVFITGVSKFAKVSIFSDLNHLEDITLDEKYATITGYTQEELEYYFKDYLQLIERKLNISHEKLMELMRIWYDGFSWDGVTHVYNPFGTLNFLQKKVFRNYWFSTGTPTFLLEQMKKHGEFIVENSKVDASFLEKSDLENIDVVQLLFQTGYLTIKSLDPMTGNMVLDYPNKEVRESMYRFLMHELVRSSGRANSGMTMDDLQNAFLTRNMPRVKVIINSFLGDLPSEVFKIKSEGIYHGLIHIIFKYLGTFIQSEVHSSFGRADAVVQTDTDVYIFEFKLNETAEIAFEQILTTRYADKYRASGKQITGIGVNFNDNKRIVEGWKAELI
jgi:Predicted AAA-ATPase/PD-(D/E)XK nuclease superfamily